MGWDGARVAWDRLGEDLGEWARGEEGQGADRRG